MPFLLTSDECELLLAFEKSPNIEGMGRVLGKDQSVISRQLKAMALKYPVLEKRQNRWHLTEMGKRMNRWSEEAIFSQQQLMQNKRTLKIATTREFASRILLPKTRPLVGNDDLTVSIISSDGGTEKLLLAGEADIGIDCGRPFDPDIAFKQVARETMLCVAAPKFLQRHNIKNFSQLLDHDHLRFLRTSGPIVGIEVKASHYFGSFSDISTLREACKLGYGWAVLPYYTIRQELKDKELMTIEMPVAKEEKFGVWWLRTRTSLSPWVNRAVAWLKDQEEFLVH